MKSNETPVDDQDSQQTDEAISGKPHPRLTQYTFNEVENAIEAIKLLIQIRDRCRSQGVIDW